MTEEEVKRTLKAIFRKVSPETDFQSINPKGNLRDQIEIDSFDAFTILVHIHEQTGVDIPDTIAAQLKTLDQLVHYIVEHSGAGDVAKP